MSRRSLEKGSTGERGGEEQLEEGGKEHREEE
jgi:hypothetical protein